MGKPFAHGSKPKLQSQAATHFTATGFSTWGLILDSQSASSFSKII